MSLHLFVFCFFNGLLLIVGFPSRFNFVSSRISHSSLSCSPVEIISTEDADSAVEVDAYLGPTSDFDDMEAGCSIGDLGNQFLPRYHGL